MRKIFELPDEDTYITSKKCFIFINDDDGHAQFGIEFPFTILWNHENYTLVFQN
jgi:hypothetical protein